MKKKIYYLAGLPRTGNTLLGSILNQNPKVKVSPNSLLGSITYSMFLLKQNSIFKNFPDHKTLDNLIKKIFEHYYDNTEAEIIFERSCWGTVANLKLLKNYFEPNPKFLLLNRPIVEIVASFMRVRKKGNLEDTLNTLMDKNNGKLIQDIRSARNIVKTKENYLMIEYDDLVNKTKESIDKIYKHFDLPKFEHNFSDLKQYSFNNAKYNDDVLDFNLHTIRTDKIEKEKFNLSDYLDEEIISKLEGYNIYE
jgi:sulfotransferase